MTEARTRIPSISSIHRFASLGEALRAARVSPTRRRRRAPREGRARARVAPERALAGGDVVGRERVRPERRRALEGRERLAPSRVLHVLGRGHELRARPLDGLVAVGARLAWARARSGQHERTGPRARSAQNGTSPATPPCRRVGGAACADGRRRRRPGARGAWTAGRSSLGVAAPAGARAKPKPGAEGLGPADGALGASPELPGSATARDRLATLTALRGLAPTASERARPPRNAERRATDIHRDPSASRRRGALSPRRCRPVRPVPARSAQQRVAWMTHFAARRPRSGHRRSARASPRIRREIGGALRRATTSVASTTVTRSAAEARATTRQRRWIRSRIKRVRIWP